jgi:hypothetical protein
VVVAEETIEPVVDPPPPAVVVPVQVRAAAEPSTIPPSGSAPAVSVVIEDLPAPEALAQIPVTVRPIRYYLAAAIGLLFLLLSALVAGFWVHSFGAIDRALHATTTGQYYWIESSSGAVYFHNERDPSPIGRQTDVWRMEFGDAWSKKDPPPRIPGAALQGVTVARVPAAGGGGQVQYVAISYWLLVIVPVLPGLWWLKNRRRLRAASIGPQANQSAASTY